MIRILLVALVLAMTGVSPTDAQGFSRHRLEVDGRAREYLLYTPARADEAGELPVVLVFHGRGGNADDVRIGTGIDGAAERHGFVAAFLEGTPEGGPGWALGCERCTAADTLGIDDVRFTRAVLADVRRRVRVDDARVFAAGFSNGGSFAMRLACAEPRLFRAFAAVGTTLARPVADSCGEARPPRILLAMGTADERVAFEGRPGPRGAMSATEGAAWWAARAGCRAEPDRRVSARLLGFGDVREARWRGCRSGSAVVSLEMTGVGHFWPRGPGFDLTDEVLRFFGIG